MSRIFIKLFIKSLQHLHKPLRLLFHFSHHLFKHKLYEEMLTPAVLRSFYNVLEKIARQNGFIAGKSGRHMKYPYTLSAKIAQFPFFHYLRNNWVCMYFPPAIIVSLYPISKIHFTVNSAEYVRNWEKTQAETAAKEAAHH